MTTKFETAKSLISAKNRIIGTLVLNISFGSAKLSKNVFTDVV